MPFNNAAARGAFFEKLKNQSGGGQTPGMMMQPKPNGLPPMGGQMPPMPNNMAPRSGGMGAMPPHITPKPMGSMAPHSPTISNPSSPQKPRFQKLNSFMKG